MTGGLYRLGRAAALRRENSGRVLLAGAARSFGPDLTDDLTLPGTGSQKATDLLNAKFPSQANGVNPVVMTAPKGAKITDAKYKSAIDDAVA